MRWTFLVALLGVTLAAACNGPAPRDADRTTTAAPTHAVEVAFVDDLVDPARDGARLPLAAYYPADATGPTPVVVVSHGGTGSEESRQALEYLGRALAEAGYVALHPSHFRQHDVPLTVSRPLDVTFLLDVIEHDGLDIPGFDGTLDAEHVGHAGHSWGAYTSMALAGAEVDVPTAYGGDDHHFTEPRLDAFLPLSPSGAGQFGLEASSWADIASPVFVIYGEAEEDSDGTGNVERAGWRGEPYDAMPPGDKYEAVLPGGEHAHFNDRGNRGTSDPLEAVVQRYVAANAVAFFDTYLRGLDRTDEIGRLADVDGVRFSAK